MSATARPDRFHTALAFTLLLCAHSASAGYGLTQASFGVESVGMAGADLATTDNSVAVNINPAGLSQVANRQFEIFVNPYYSMRSGHSDGYGNDQHRLDNPVGGTLALSYAHRLSPTLVLGSGLFVQGGSGFEYEELETAFGTRDEINVSLGIVKLATGAGWQLNEKLSVGATLGLHVATLRQQLFPNTSDAAAGFFGARYDGGRDFAPNIKLGLQYRPVPSLTLAAAYSSLTDFDIGHGTLTVNYESLGLGRVTYRDATMDGLALAQDFGLSAAWQATPRLRLALELSWLDWSKAMRQTRLQARNPDTAGLPAALESLDVRTPLDWRDQYAVALGVEWKHDDRTTLRAGFDRVSRATPRSTLSPLLNLIQGEEITAAITRRLDSGLDLGLALQYQFLQHLQYSNPSLPFGDQAREDYEVLAVVLALSRRW
ncbi:MAG TPA: outer membrane protein transport protein [Solimonas sp.]|nr:outer membrane protein transport protein [Solimonas sp.]